MRARQAGFTLLELLVVLVILGLSAAVALPTLTRGPGRADLARGAQEVAAALRAARALAITENRPASFTADTLSGHFAAEGQPEKTVPDGIGLSVLTVTGQAAGDRAGIRFFPDGSSTGGGVVLSRGALSYEVGVSWLTGAATVRERSDEGG